MMSAESSKSDGFMFPEKDVSQRGITIPLFGRHGKHTFCGTFTTGKPDVSRVSRYAESGKHCKHKNITTPQNFRIMGKGVRR